MKIGHYSSWKNGLFFVSGLLIGASVFLLVQASYTVQTDLTNAVQVIKKIVVENTNGTTGTVIDGATIATSNIDASSLNTSVTTASSHMSANEYCDVSGQNCVDIATVNTGTSLGTESDPVFLAHSGDYYLDNPAGYISGYTETDPVFLSHSGDYYSTGQADARFLTGESWAQIGDDIVFSRGNVGIGTESPSDKLHVVGDTIMEGSQVTDGLVIYTPREKNYLGSEGLLTITPNGTYYKASFAYPGTDQLVGFANGTTGGQLFILQVDSVADKHNILLTGTNIKLGDTNLLTTDDTLSLIRDGSYWVEISRSNNLSTLEREAP